MVNRCGHLFGGGGDRLAQQDPLQSLQVAASRGAEERLHDPAVRGGVDGLPPS
ncbi:hypothetical protein ACFYZ3_29270 [Streptomyces sp. NPDC001599]|uniref:hypothetical protein n=1 Tax=Streptomyces sp. NPDC001599 TaxID=3364591 RepID=UPI0036CEF712